MTLSTALPATSGVISDAYREQNRQLHERRPDYGTSGARWAAIVQKLVKDYECASVLDYGCGKMTLMQSLPVGIPVDFRNYDPCIPGLDAAPDPADLVVVGDVMEHIEPDHLTAVLDHIHGLARKVVLFVVSTVPAAKTLPDGRNAHICLMSPEEWMTKFTSRWRLDAFQRWGHEFSAVMAHDPAVRRWV